jgi:hypothetical protein
MLTNNQLRGVRLKPLQSGKGEKIRRKQPQHINANILSTIAIIEIIATLVATTRKNVGNCIQR